MGLSVNNQSACIERSSPWSEPKPNPTAPPRITVHKDTVSWTQRRNRCLSIHEFAQRPLVARCFSQQYLALFKSFIKPGYRGCSKMQYVENNKQPKLVLQLGPPEGGRRWPDAERLCAGETLFGGAILLHCITVSFIPAIITRYLIWAVS